MATELFLIFRNSNALKTS